MTRVNSNYLIVLEDIRVLLTTWNCEELYTVGVLLINIKWFYNICRRVTVPGGN